MEYLIHDRQITPPQAAERFASEAFGRDVGTKCAVKDAALIFQLVDGVKWYAVRLLPDYSGFAITEYHN